MQVILLEEGFCLLHSPPYRLSEEKCAPDAQRRRILGKPVGTALFAKPDSLQFRSYMQSCLRKMLLEAVTLFRLLKVSL